MTKTLSYLKAVVICHGKSEKQMCDFIKSNLRIRIAVESDKKSEKSIQVTSVMKILNSRKFKTFQDFITTFEDVEICKIKTKKFLTDDFKIFIILDTDDCNEAQKKAFINKEMFRNHWAYRYIFPIYNNPQLESVLTKSHIKFEKKGDARKQEYIKIFPTDPKYQRREVIQVKEFGDNLRKNPDTNMEEFIDFCLNLKNTNS